MNNIRRFFALLLALGLAGALCPPVRAAEAPAGDGPVRAVVVFEEDAAAGDLTALLSALPGTETLWSYGALFSGAAIEAPENVLRALEETAGIAGVGRSRSHTRSAAIHNPLTATNSLPVMGAQSTEYSGDGVVIAVLDDSLRVSHEVFGDYGLTEHPVLSRQDVSAFTAGGGARGRYISAKLPFVYDYAGRDADVSAQEDHGTHVSALAAGYAPGEDGAPVFTGAAPAAQLVFMKVFTDGKDSRADDAVILRAMEDAYQLGADIINLSLGTDNGFTEDEILEEVYGDIFRRLEENGVLVFCAAGNSGTVVTEKAAGVPLPSTGYADYGSASSPGTYRGAVSVAAADAMVRQSTGGILAGGQRWAFVDGDPDEGMSVPSLETLADKELRFVPVGGVGTAADYEGLDVTGAAALVERGEITFTEKARNAAAAGAAACLVYNNVPGGVIPSVEDLPIPCAIVSQAAGAALLELAEKGENTLMVREDAYIETLHETPAIYEYSAWGTTSDLRLLPMLTAPGGSVLSAGAEDDAAYLQMSGTSMASPNAAGIAAGVLQALRERRPELTRAQRGRLALDLLASTAEILLDENEPPLSPRRQGAGLVNQDAALSAGAVIENPLLELGESGDGSFTAVLQIQNLTDQPLELTVDAQVLTDAWTEENGRTYSALTALDITDRVEISGDKTVKLPAGGSGEASVTLKVRPEAFEELGEIFPNGFFTEGYIHLRGEETGPLHAAFLGFCGDWKAAPILEPVTNREVLDFLAETGGEGDWREELPIDLGANLVYITGGEDGFDPESALLLGENAWGYTPWGDRRGAISTENPDSLYSGGSLFVVEPVLLRNAAHLIMLVRREADGEICAVDDTPWLPRAGMVNGAAASSGLFLWDGTGRDGEPLPEGTTVQVEFYAWLDSDTEMEAAYAAHGEGDYAWLTAEDYGDRLEWSFPVTIDGTAPTVLAGLDDPAAGDAWSGTEAAELARTLPEEGGETLVITLRDEQYLARAAVYGEGEEPLAELLFAPEEAGKTYVLRLGFDGPEELPEHLYVTASDYAANTVGLDFDLGALARGEAPEPSVCPAAMLTDVAAGAWYHEAVDYVCGRGLMEAEEGFVFRPRENASRAELLDALYRAAGSPRPGGGKLPFRDVPVGAWYRDAVRWAYELGIAGGFDGETFGALAPLTRQQLAVILYRCASLGGKPPAEGDLSAFTDGEAVASWAREAMAWAAGKGILSGDASGRLNPEGYAARSETAAILMRYLEG